MILKNKFNWPDPLFQAIAKDDYFNDADLSVTEIINPAQMVVLQKRHINELEQDVSERFWSAMGRSMHLLLANHTTQESVVYEKRMYQEVEGLKLGGQFDFYDKTTKTLSDYKFVGWFAWKMAKQAGKPEWEAQLNCYRWLLWKESKELADRLEIVCLIRDWMESGKAKEKEYPETPVARLTIPIWPIERAEAYIRERVLAYKKAAILDARTLPKCTDAERWMSQQGVPRRCRSYCMVRHVCHQNGFRFDVVKP